MSNEPLGWTALERVPLADYGIFRVARKEGVSPRTGRPVQFHVLDASDWVQVVSVASDGRFILVEQFRHGADVRSIEFPAGIVDPGEDHGAAGRRELLEESGYAPGRMVFLGSVYPNPAIQSNRLHVWLALDCELTAAPQLDEGEDIRVLMTDEAGMRKMIERGDINHALVIAAFHLYESWRSQRSASRT